PHDRGRARESEEPGARAPGSSCVVRRCLSLDWLDGRGLRALLALRHVVLDALPLIEVAVPVSGDRAEVYEHVCAAIFGSDEAEPLLGADPLHGSGCHSDPSFLRRPSPSVELLIRRRRDIRRCEGTARSEPRPVPSPVTLTEAGPARRGASVVRPGRTGTLDVWKRP